MELYGLVGLDACERRSKRYQRTVQLTLKFNRIPAIMAARKSPSRGRKPDKWWREALLSELREHLDGKGNPTRLEALAEKLVQLALEGDIEAIKEIANRLDGRPTQPPQENSDTQIVVRLIE